MSSHSTHSSPLTTHHEISLPLTPPESPIVSSEYTPWSSPVKRSRSNCPTFNRTLHLFSQNDGEVETTTYTGYNHRSTSPKVGKGVWQKDEKQWKRLDDVQAAEDVSRASVMSERMIPTDGSWLGSESAMPNPLSDPFVERISSESSIRAPPMTPSMSIGGRFGNFFNRMKQSPPLETTNDDVNTLSQNPSSYTNNLQSPSPKPSQVSRNIQTIAENLQSLAQNGARRIQSTNERKEEESMTRTEHLKLQLEGMAQRVAEYDAQMESLRAELRTEREAWEAQRRAWKASLAEEETLTISRAGSLREWRDDISSSESLIDDDESVADSVFSSASRMTKTSRSYRSSPLISDLDDMPQITPIRSKVSVAPSSTFSKVFGRPEKTPEACVNCKGSSEGTAWESVRVLRGENATLKERIASLEAAVDGALELVAGLGIR